MAVCFEGVFSFLFASIAKTTAPETMEVVFRCLASAAVLGLAREIDGIYRLSTTGGAFLKSNALGFLTAEENSLSEVLWLRVGCQLALDSGLAAIVSTDKSPVSAYLILIKCCVALLGMSPGLFFMASFIFLLQICRSTKARLSAKNFESCASVLYAYVIAYTFYLTMAFFMGRKFFPLLYFLDRGIFVSTIFALFTALKGFFPDKKTRVLLADIQLAENIEEDDETQDDDVASWAGTTRTMSRYEPPSSSSVDDGACVVDFVDDSVVIAPLTDGEKNPPPKATRGILVAATI